jgi:hypothetical protein
MRNKGNRSRRDERLMTGGSRDRAAQPSSAAPLEVPSSLLASSYESRCNSITARAAIVTPETVTASAATAGA